MSENHAGLCCSRLEYAAVLFNNKHMATLNHVTLIGNLTRDIELRNTAGGNAVGNTGIALNRKWKDGSGQEKEEVTFVDITIWGKTAEVCAKYLRKGSQVCVNGRLRSEEWADKTTGAKRTKLGVVADDVLFLGGKTDTAASARPTKADAAPYDDSDNGGEIPW